MSGRPFASGALLDHCPPRHSSLRAGGSLLERTRHRELLILPTPNWKEATFAILAIYSYSLREKCMDPCQGVKYSLEFHICRGQNNIKNIFMISIGGV